MITNQSEFSALDEMIAAAPESPAFLVMPAESALTISSLTIAELVESRHDKVKQSIERLAESGVISLPPLGEVKIQRERRVETVSVYLVGKRDSYVVVAQLSPKFTGALVDRWQELEAKQVATAAPAPVALPSYPEALRLYAAEIEKTAKLETTVSELTPKAEALDRIADADGQLNITQAAKVLQVSPKWLFTYLNVNGWTYRCQSTGAWVPYQERIKSGVMSARVHTLTNQTTGEEMLKHQAYITPKGITALSKSISKNARP